MSAKDDWPREKNWKHVYTRSEKMKRAKQLGMEYPVVSEHKRIDDEQVNVLFVCSRNQWRSPTAERMFKGHPVIVARSAGTSLSARHRMSHADIDWADVIMVMEDKHRQRIVAEYTRLVEHTPIHVLDIPDEYRYMDPELIDILEQTVEPLLFA
jgi:predicted protein tyrosine phosphatase